MEEAGDGGLIYTAGSSTLALCADTFSMLRVSSHKIDYFALKAKQTTTYLKHTVEVVRVGFPLHCNFKLNLLQTDFLGQTSLLSPVFTQLRTPGDTESSPTEGISSHVVSMNFLLTVPQSLSIISVLVLVCVPHRARPRKT